MIPGIASTAVPLPIQGIKLKKASNFTFVRWPRTEPGDFAIFFNLGAGSPPPAGVIPTGFTQLINASGGITRCVVAYKLCDGSETGLLDRMASSGSVLYIFSGGSVSVTPSTWNHEISPQNNVPGSQSVTTGSATPPIIVFGVAGGPPGSSNDLGSSPSFFRKDFTSRLTVGFKIYPSSPANHTITTTEGGSFNGTWLASGYFTLTPDT